MNFKLSYLRLGMIPELSHSKAVNSIAQSISTTTSNAARDSFQSSTSKRNFFNRIQKAVANFKIGLHKDKIVTLNGEKCDIKGDNFTVKQGLFSLFSSSTPKEGLYKITKDGEKHIFKIDKSGKVLAHEIDGKIRVFKNNYLSKIISHTRKRVITFLNPQEYNRRDFGHQIMRMAKESSNINSYKTSNLKFVNGRYTIGGKVLNGDYRTIFKDGKRTLTVTTFDKGQKVREIEYTPLKCFYDVCITEKDGTQTKFTITKATEKHPEKVIQALKSEHLKL